MLGKKVITQLFHEENVSEYHLLEIIVSIWTISYKNKRRIIIKSLNI